jgi:gamma-glutamyltranspeptidase/glutathione hydrolase
MPLERTRSHWLHDKTEASATAGMVSSRHPLSAEAGLEVLKAGGNAVDAAVAASFAESVVQPAASTIGGGGLFTFRDPSGIASGINYMWQAPLAARPDMFPIEGTPRRGLFGWSGVKDNANEFGGLAVAVPGSVAGLVKAQRKHGRLAFTHVLKPAIRFATEGFAMDWYGCLMAGIHLDIIKKYPTAARMLLRDGQYPPRPDMIGRADIHRQPELARTLERIADSGDAAFYRGDIAASIVEAVNANGGIFTIDDLATYEAVETTPIDIRYRDHRITGDPSGFIFYAQVLNTLAHFDVGSLKPDSAGWLHLLIEVFRHCLADRNKAGYDYRVPEGSWRYLVSEDYASQLAGMIDTGRRVDVPSHFDGTSRAAPVGQSRTVHIAAIDVDGGMASLTETVIGNYGSYVMTETGVLLNNGMISFAPVPGYPNSISPGCRSPSSFISPLHVTRPDGRSIVTIGSSGGSKIMTSVLQIASYIMDQGMSVQEAVSYPRLDFEGSKVILDGRYSGETVTELRRRGHEIEIRSEGLSTFEFGNPSVLARNADGIVTGGVNPYQATIAVGYDRN